ncbi:MAG: hypothetical protein AB1304_07745 [Bacteroidota bacterium]
MIFKINFHTFWVIICCFALNYCDAQKSMKGEFLILKIEYSDLIHGDTIYLGCYMGDYCLISIDKLKSFRVIDTDKKTLPSIVYNITANGGFYMSMAFTDIYSYGCCKFGSVEKAIEQLVNGKIQENEINDYQQVNKLSESVFENYFGKKFSLNNKTGKYDIKIWIADLEFCICPLYMESPHQPIFNNNAAYIKNINSISCPNKNIYKRFKKIVERIVFMDEK